MEKYEPKSRFLLDILAGLVPLSDGEFGERNLRRLIALTRDVDYSNRDWATFLLAQQERDTPAVRDALLHAAADDDEIIRAEAIWGLAFIDRDLALSLVQQALAAGTIVSDVFEAAALVAHPSLVDSLREWIEHPSGSTYLDEIKSDALIACETGIPYPNRSKTA